ncbi:MAG: class I SAM-dependent rRNA methyltransferase [Ferrovibrio sp.]|uniref:class I SAM-dependent rRNA methyltransferase n=1 Tax=Ferrovibrio sp. TaxID=1917215 RepID=UPI00263572CD|nr:class I SAM-dependent rRNA methyltransferase [Ferrovibrio sp.]MCW0236567.1 class I SAM-dependent rRNA methyltransferase [Ferrovibrio sp.]
MTFNTLPVLRVKAREDRRVRGGHPWVYSNEIALDAEAKAVAPGSLVRLVDSQGETLGIASFNAHSLIAARLWTAAAATVDAGFLAGRLRAALALRERCFAQPYYRLVHAEADGMPGFIIDRYGDVLCVQANTAGAEHLLPQLLESLDAVLKPRAVVLRNDTPVRALEGLQPEIRLAAGSLDDMPAAVEEGGCRVSLDLLEGQKTGWYFDLAGARALIAGMAKGEDMLDVYCNSGGFALTAAKAGAKSVRGIDRSELAIGQAVQAAKDNALSRIAKFEKAEAFPALEQLQGEKASFGIVVTDPPNFVKSRKDLGPGAKAYRKLAKLAVPLVRPGGLWFVACCAHLLPGEAFAREVAIGLSQAGRSGRILYSGGAGPDHPVHPHLPESAYLKWQILQID